MYTYSFALRSFLAGVFGTFLALLSMKLFGWPPAKHLWAPLVVSLLIGGMVYMFSDRTIK